MPVTITHAKSNIVADFTGVVTVGNSSGGTTTMQATDLVRPQDWNSNHVATISLTGAECGHLFAAGAGMTVSTNANGITYGRGDEEFFEPFPLFLTATTSHTPGIGTWYFDPVYLPFPILSGRINTPVTVGSAVINAAQMSCGATSHSGIASVSQTFWHNFAIYAQNTGANNTRLSLYWTGQVSFGATNVKRVSNVATATSQIQVTNELYLQLPGQWDSLGGVVYSTVSTSGTLSAAATSLLSSSIDSLVSGIGAYVSGSRMDIFGLNTSMAPGNYVFAYQFSSSSASSSTGGLNYVGGTMISTHVRPMALELNLGGYKQLGKTVSNTTSQAYPWHGFVTTAQSTAYSTIATSDLRGTNVRAYWNIRGNAIT